MYILYVEIIQEGALIEIMSANSVKKMNKTFTRHCAVSGADSEPQFNYLKLKMFLWKTVLQLWGEKIANQIKRKHPHE